MDKTVRIKIALRSPGPLSPIPRLKYGFNCREQASARGLRNIFCPLGVFALGLLGAAEPIFGGGAWPFGLPKAAPAKLNSLDH
jgi:hypothetical protein